MRFLSLHQASTLGLALLLLPAGLAAQTIVTPLPDAETVFTDGTLTLLVSQTGYAVPGVRQAFLLAPSRSAGEAAGLYRVVDISGSEVLAGLPAYTGEWLGAHFFRIDLDALETPGDYRLKIGEAGPGAVLASQLFPVRVAAEHYLDAHAADMMVAQMSARIRTDALGGFIDSGNDIRETNSHSTQLLGMLAMLERYGHRFTPAEQAAIDGYLDHFAAFLESQEDVDGRFRGGYAFGNPIADGHWPNHLRAVDALIALARYRLAADPTSPQAARLLAAARRGIEHTRREQDEALAHTSLLTERLLTEVDYHLVTADPTALAEARALGIELRARQVVLPEVSAEGFHGLFRELPSSPGYARLNHHDFGDMTGEYWGLPLWGLARLLDAYPADADAPMWRATVEDHVRGFLVPAALRSPFGLVANGEYQGARWFSDLFHGMSMTYALSAYSLLVYADALADPALADLAEAQLLWIQGLNTGTAFAAFPAGGEPFSCIVGKGYQWLRDGHGVLQDVPGSIVNGLSATPQFVKEMPAGVEQPAYLCDESWIAHTGGWLMATAELVRARLRVGNTLAVTRGIAPGSLRLKWRDVPGAAAYRAFFSADARLAAPAPAGSAPSGDPGLDVPAPAGALVFLRVTGSDGVNDGPL